MSIFVTTHLFSRRTDKLNNSIAFHVLLLICFNFTDIKWHYSVLNPVSFINISVVCQVRREDWIESSSCFYLRRWNDAFCSFLHLWKWTSWGIEPLSYVDWEYAVIVVVSSHVFLHQPREFACNSRHFLALRKKGQKRSRCHVSCHRCFVYLMLIQCCLLLHFRVEFTRLWAYDEASENQKRWDHNSLFMCFDTFYF